MRGYLRTNWLAPALKVVCLLVIVGAVIAGHPPSSGQDQESWRDAKQDTQISDIQAKLADLTAMQVTIGKQAEDIARLDQKMTDLFAGLGVLQVLGIGVSFKQYKRKAGA